jgi:hypothetical protein
MLSLKSAAYPINQSLRCVEWRDALGASTPVSDRLYLVGHTARRGSGGRECYVPWVKVWAELFVVGLCVGFCQKGLGVTFQEVENLLLDIPVVLLAPTL